MPTTFHAVDPGDATSPPCRNKLTGAKVHHLPTEYEYAARYDVETEI
jgi:hypothetical protein